VVKNPRGGRSSPPLGFFVSVASKGFRFGVSLLDATLTRRFISVADKGVKGRAGRADRGGISGHYWRASFWPKERTAEIEWARENRQQGCWRSREKAGKGVWIHETM